jgi:hypothetical protein
MHATGDYSITDLAELFTIAFSPTASAGKCTS